jgi:hypothetical protein
MRSWQQVTEHGYSLTEQWYSPATTNIKEFTKQAGVGWYSPSIQKFVGFIWLFIDHGNNLSTVFTACMYAIHNKIGYLLGI